jgi:hypothetical protein
MLGIFNKGLNMSKFLDFNKFILDSSVHINNYINRLSHPCMVDLSMNISKDLKISSGIILDFGTNLPSLDFLYWSLDSGHAVSVTPHKSYTTIDKEILSALKRFEELRNIAHDYDVPHSFSGGVILKLKHEVDLDALSNVLFEHNFSALYFNPDFFSNQKSLAYSLNLLEVCLEHEVPLIVGDTSGLDIAAYNILDKNFTGIVVPSSGENIVQPVLDLSDQLSSKDFKILSKINYCANPQVMVKSFIAGASAVILDLDIRNSKVNDSIVDRICEEIKRGIYYAGYESLSDIVGTLDWSISV